MVSWWCHDGGMGGESGGGWGGNHFASDGRAQSGLFVRFKVGYSGL